MVWRDVEELSEKNCSYSSTSDLGEVLNSINYNDEINIFDDIEFNGFIVFGSGRPFVEIFPVKKIPKNNCKNQLKHGLLIKILFREYK